MRRTGRSRMKRIVVPLLILLLLAAAVLPVVARGVQEKPIEPAAQPQPPAKDYLGLVSAFKSYGHVYDKNNVEAMRPLIMGTHGVVASGHYISSLAGIEILKRGGNAFDAGVGAAMALKVMKMDFAGWCGVAPVVLYSARDNEVVTRTGAGTSPAKLSIDFFLEHGKTPVTTALLPADVDVWLNVLARYGTRSFEEMAQYALDAAENGYHLYKMQIDNFKAEREGILKWPTNTEFWYQHGVDRVPQLGDLMKNPNLGRLIRYMIDAEREALAAGKSREEAILAARDAFYKGEPAKAVGEFFSQQKDGIVTYEDMAGYQGKWVAPIHTTYRGYDVYAPEGWSQAPRMILFLNMLENFNVKELGYNTPEYIHLITQVINLGMSDCHKYIGDPDFADTPPQLYSKEYAKERIKLIDMKKAFQDMPPWGDPANMKAVADDSPTQFAFTETSDPVEVASLKMTERALAHDTTSLNVMDAAGNIFSMTESDGHTDTPIIPGWGFGLGGRMSQFNLDSSLANAAAPGKRPRNTNGPVLAMKDGKPFLGFTTPGGDQQNQSLLQVFLNIVEWGMDVQQALDQPRFGSYNFPGTGSEVNRNPAVMNVEDRIPPETVEALKAMGHNVKSWGLWNWLACAPTVTYRDPQTGILMTAADVRREAYALGY